MTDSKTEKKIEVRQCPAHKDRFALTVNGLWYIDPNTFGMANFCVGTEAEAQAKAAELEMAESCKIIADASIEEGKELAAQPTETRPPQDEYKCLECNRYFSTLADLQAHMHDETARAAAPVEPPSDCTHENKRYVGSVPWCIDCGKTLAATELVEPAPRPQFCGWCGRIDCTTHPSSAPGPSAAPTHFGCCGRSFTRGHAQSCAAASSPVARPQDDCKCGHTAAQHKQCAEGEYCDVKGCPCVDGNAEGFTLPAARVEQPTPHNFLSDFQMPSCSQCGATYKVYCAECGNFKPAAPVVEQRHTFDALRKEAEDFVAEWSIAIQEVQVYELHKLLSRISREAQRTEGEGQHGK